MGSEVIFRGHSRPLGNVASRVSSKNDLRPHFIVPLLLASLVAAGCTDRVDAGRQLYMTHGCAVCHGAGGRGDGPSAARMVVPPTDFANVDGYREGSSLENIARTIRYGMSVPGPMPPFAHISEEDARLLAAWIVSLQGTDGAQPAAAAASNVVVRDAWVRESTATRTISSGYVTIDNACGARPYAGRSGGRRSRTRRASHRAPGWRRGHAARRIADDSGAIGRGSGAGRHACHAVRRESTAGRRRRGDDDAHLR